MPSQGEVDEAILVGFRAGAKHAPLAQKGLAVFANYTLVQAERGKEAPGCREQEEWTLGLGPVSWAGRRGCSGCGDRGTFLGGPPGICGLGSGGCLNMPVLL